MLIRIEQVHFAYPGEVKALNGVTMQIEPGEQVALVGGNGSGKTTLARHLNGLLRPQLGRVQIGGWLTIEHTPAQMARRVAYVFQNPDEQLFRQRIWDEVAFGPQNLGYEPSRVQALVEQALDRMGLSDFKQLNPRDLGYSGRKRVALACALAMDTPVVVLDEPSGGLDADEQGQLEQILRDLRHRGKTSLVISHDMDFVAEVLDRVVVLNQGRVLLDGSAQDVFSRVDLLDSAGVNLPQIARLSQGLGQARLSLTVEQFLEDRSRAAG